jgi:hypothetical protein
MISIEIQLIVECEEHTIKKSDDAVLAPKNKFKKYIKYSHIVSSLSRMNKVDKIMIGHEMVIIGTND